VFVGGDGERKAHACRVAPLRTFVLHRIIVNDAHTAAGPDTTALASPRRKHTNEAAGPPNESRSRASRLVPVSLPYQFDFGFRHALGQRPAPPCASVLAMNMIAIAHKRAERSKKTRADSRTMNHRGGPPIKDRPGPFTRRKALSVPELAIIAGTRAALGAGVG